MSPASPDARTLLPPGPVPRHVAIIMDGNGRWAEQRGEIRLSGHRRGSSSVHEVTTGARELGVEALTLYAFSAQNWSRPAEEVQGLMQILWEHLESERPTLLENDIRLQAIGQLERLPSFVRERLDALIAETAHAKSMVLTLALSYGGREELVEVARRLAREAQAGRLDPDAIDEALVDRHTFTHGLPPLDLIVRTSGELRLSNFLLWQAAYAEIVVTDVLWPEFGKQALCDAIATYRGRERRFGLTGSQVRAPTPEVD